ncbi:hypothetical protein [Deefgea salmonis]|nr:hypothetical protein [Deefgea salmonis]
MYTYRFLDSEPIGKINWRVTACMPVRAAAIQTRLARAKVVGLIK